MATAIHPGRSLCCAMCYPVFHIVSGDLRMALILHLVQLVEASTWGRGNEHAQVKDITAFCSAGFISPSHSSVFTVESIFSAFQLLAHSPWVLASPHGGSLKCESHASDSLGLII